MTLYHCEQVRSFRALWTLHELGIAGYKLVTMPFPPRTSVPGYMDLNPLGTVPFFVHGETQMTESCAIPMYLVDKFDATEFKIDPTEKDFGAYLDWLARADATLTFPQSVFMRFCKFETHRGLEEAGDLYAKWFFARLRCLETALGDGREFLCGGRFTIADVCVTFPLHFASHIGLNTKFRPFKPLTMAYLDRMRARPCFTTAVEEERISMSKWPGCLDMQGR